MVYGGLSAVEQGSRAPWVVAAMSGKSGLEVKAGVDGEDVEELTRGEGGYEGGAQGEVRRGEDGYNGGTVGGNAGSDSGGAVNVQQRIEALERKIAELEAQIKTSKSSESSQFELVNMKNMTPTVLKDGTAFRNWREDFEVRRPESQGPSRRAEINRWAQELE